MIKELALISMLSSSISSDYVCVNKIEYYQSDEVNKKIRFEFQSDYFKVHEIDTKIELYDINDTYLASYNSSLEVIGNRNAIASFNYNNENDFYVLIDVKYDDTYLIKSVKINFYNQEDCFINKDNLICNFIYKSEYSEGISKDVITNFRVDNNIFDKFLSFNKLSVENIKFYSDYKFENANISLVIENEIKEYNLLYDQGYKFILNISEDKFNLLDNYYVNLLNFSYSESYFENSNKVNSIYFPYFKDYKEYNCYIIIEDFINIKIDFNVSTSDLLYGKCNDSKYCLVRESYD